jgi:hypothetical protein
MTTRTPKSSFEKFHYGLRPAKNVERKMMADAIRRLLAFHPISEFQYVGMGSLYFSDFILFHRLLNFRKMVSIESQENDRERIKFNQPFGCIDIEFGYTTEILPRLKWKMPSVVWLDYDGKIESSCLDDVATLATNVVSGSLIVFSFNVDPDKVRFNQTGSAKNSFLAKDDDADDDSSDENMDLLDYLNEEFAGSDMLRVGLKKTGLANWGFASVTREMIDNQIKETLTRRNGVSNKEDERFLYRQVFNFHYQDGTKMLTVGGVIYKKKDANLLINCKFDDLYFTRTNEDAFSIRPPLITFREVRALDTFMPDNGSRSKVPISAEMIEKYAEIYRYFPNFTEAEI